MPGTNLSRKSLFFGFQPADLRPPWALHEPDFIETCTGCRACIERCPENVLRTGSGGFAVFDPQPIDGYQVDRNSNRCMLCHARANAATFQAPPVSVTHYMDRDDQFLATISPRRYFCSQCHVVQTDAQPLVASNFQDIDSVISAQPRSE